MAKTFILNKSIFIACVALIYLVSLSRCDLLVTQANTTGFTIDLIHRDSPQSPFYDPSLSPTQRLVNSLRRSQKYIQRFNESRFRQSPESDIIKGNAEYLLKYSIGTPPVDSFGIIDTGSNLLWTQCKPCLKCYHQNLTVFDPKMSSTYKRITCTSPYCNITQPKTICGARSNTCMYGVTYADGMFSKGSLAEDVLTLASVGGTRTLIPNFFFGCGHINKDVYSGGESGTVGLASGKVSLVSQLGPLAQGKFSYCLIPHTDISKTSKLNFGDNSEVSGGGVVFTPLVRKRPYYLYFVTLLGIKVGDQRLDYYKPESDLPEEGNIIIDSGTPITYLPTILYSLLKTALLNQVELKTTKDDFLDLCFYTRNFVLMPNITFHFQGADVNLKQQNLFIRRSATSYCLAANPATTHAIYGNIAQANYLVGFDIEKRSVHFKPTDCGNL